VSQDSPGSPQAAEFPAASGDFVPGGRQVGGQDYGFKNGAILFKLSAIGSQSGREPARRSEPAELMEKLKQDGEKSKLSQKPAEFLLNNYKDIGIVAA
jgi:hypothetical protein